MSRSRFKASLTLSTSDVSSPTLFASPLKQTTPNISPPPLFSDSVDFSRLCYLCIFPLKSFRHKRCFSRRILSLCLFPPHVRSRSRGKKVHLTSELKLPHRTQDFTLALRHAFDPLRGEYYKLTVKKRGTLRYNTAKKKFQQQLLGLRKKNVVLEVDEFTKKKKV